MNPKQKYFQILGIPPTTDKTIIKKAYRKLAFKYHPDVNDSAEAQSKFIELTDAYDILLGVKKLPKTRAGAVRKKGNNTTSESTKYEREERIKAAKARYKKAKQKELEDEATYYLKMISGKKWKFFKIFSVFSSIFALALCVDFSWPTESQLFVVEGATTSDFLKVISFEFENSTYIFDYVYKDLIHDFPLIKVQVTPLFNDLKTYTFVGGPMANVPIEPMFCYVYFFPIVVGLLFIPLLTVWYKRPTPFFSILYKVGYYISPILFLIVCFSNWRIFQIFL